MNYSSLLSPIAAAALLGCYSEKPDENHSWRVSETVQFSLGDAAFHPGDTDPSS